MYEKDGSIPVRKSKSGKLNWMSSLLMVPIRFYYKGVALHNYVQASVRFCIVCALKREILASLAFLIDAFKGLAGIYLIRSFGRIFSEIEIEIHTFSFKKRHLKCRVQNGAHHYNDVIMGAMAFQITGPTFVYSTVYSGTNQRKHQSSASLAFVRGIHCSPVNSPYKGQWREALMFSLIYPVWHGISPFWHQ